MTGFDFSWQKFVCIFICDIHDETHRCPRPSKTLFLWISSPRNTQQESSCYLSFVFPPRNLYMYLTCCVLGCLHAISSWAVLIAHEICNPWGGLVLETRFLVWQTFYLEKAKDFARERNRWAYWIWHAWLSPHCSFRSRPTHLDHASLQADVCYKMFIKTCNAPK